MSKKMNLIKEKERALSHVELTDEFELFLDTISNILKQKNKYINH